MTKYYVAAIESKDKAGGLTLEWMGYSTSLWMRDAFVNTCMKRIGVCHYRIEGGTDKYNVYTAEFSSIHEMNDYARTMYVERYFISGDDRIIAVPIRGTVSPYKGRFIVSTMADIYDSSYIGFMRNAESIYIKSDMRKLDRALKRFSWDFFNDDFRGKSDTIIKSISICVKTIGSIVDSDGDPVIDTDRWDIAQYGVNRRFYSVF